MPTAAYTPNLQFPVSTSPVRSQSIRFSVDKDHLRRLEVEPGVIVYHIYPTLASWIGRDTPDEVNPRSHEMHTITGNVPGEIEKTIHNDPEDFYLANRGVTILAEALSYDPNKQVVEIAMSESHGDDARHGMADGGTTDAVIARVQKAIADTFGIEHFRDLSSEQIPGYLSRSRLHLEVIVGLEDRDRIGRLVQGRNTSRQVRSWTMADFKGDFKWIKEVLEADSSPFKERIGYEENAGRRVTILEVLAVLTLFHKAYDVKGKAPTVAYSSKGRMDSRLTDSDTSEGYRALAPILPDILDLHDYIYAGFHAAYRQARPNGRLGRRGSDEDRIFPRLTKELPLTGRKADYVVPSGVLYPLLASLRALVRYDKNGKAKWRMSPFRFFDEHGGELMDNLFEQLDVVKGNPQTLGKTKTVYTALYNQARLMVVDAEAEGSS